MKKIIFLSIAVLLFSFISIQLVFAIGQTTKPIVIKDVLRGQEFTAELQMVNSEDKEVVYKLTAEGQIANWASFYETSDKDLKNKITEIKIPAKSRVRAIVKFLIPADAPNGQYSGEVVVMTESSDNEQKEGNASANVLERVGRAVSIGVTDKEIIDLQATVIPSKYGVNKGEPLKIKINYYNNGNVSMKPDVQLKILKEGNAIFNATFSYPESENAIKPKERKTLSYVEWSSSGQETGNYRAEVKVLHNGQIVAENSFKFSIGYFSNSIWISAVSFLGGGNLFFGWFVSGVILLAIVILYDILRKKGINFAKGQAIFNNIRKLF